jgi:nicotinamidase-related amidase
MEGVELKPALIVVDLLRDTFEKHPDAPVVLTARNFLPKLNRIIDQFHGWHLPVVFACDSFLPDDFIFKGKMSPHSLRGTPGEEVITDLHRQPRDHVVPKRRFSAFFKTDLDQTVRTLNVDTVAVAGIATPICVMATVLDALSHDFRAVIIEDCCAAHRAEHHGVVLEAYRRTPLHPLLQVLSTEELLDRISDQRD